ncbi:helix-turn-helix domain-containing protein [Schaedlerella arabinosiphila]|jgi:hypothetical protein|uniref:Helix-turn-helix domain-containing protein n=1 Tax=Schaedlerella arabinosiphila TaxID=2044587 RepID=A0A3R8R4X3_9FIRM|nr:helix-turn-helix domain-containing protein [Schaedlerella arabinosiphila]RRK32141.1 helix-turn-helix domain-containing protein [Schaedlerella arabinosiphila]
MEFKEILQKAREYDRKAMMEVIEMYRPLMVKYAVVNGRFDEDLYQEFVYTMLQCILKFPVEKYEDGNRMDAVLWK